MDDGVGGWSDDEKPTRSVISCDLVARFGIGNGGVVRGRSSWDRGHSWLCENVVGITGVLHVGEGWVGGSGSGEGWEGGVRGAAPAPHTEGQMRLCFGQSFLAIPWT